jgi:hypothetical protein
VNSPARSALLLALALGALGVARAGAAEAVSIEEVRARLENAPRAHPRLIASDAELGALRGALLAGGLRQRLAEETLRQAEAALKEPPVERKLEGRRLLGQSRACLGRVLALSSAYHLTGRREFAERCEREMLAAAGFEDWNPSHFLDVAEMSLALAIGYDWLFDQLSEDARRQIGAALIEKALRLPFETRHNGWVRASNNWGQVCHAGLVAAAIALLDREPDLAARTIHSAANNVRRSMEAYAPHGSYPEGPGYWSYGTTFNVVLIAALERALGTDFGLTDMPGFRETGQYIPLVTGPSGLTFNYADGGPGRSPEPALHWLARRFNRGDWLRDEAELIRARVNRAGRLMALSLLWLDESLLSAPQRLPLHWHSGGEVPISVHRTSWDDARAVFVGVKGGSPSANHGNMDAGSFVLDTRGIRWAVDLGAENYYRIESRGMNLWSRAQDSDRWKVFRQMNHSHNTLVIDDQLQTAAGFASFERFSDRPEFAFSIVNLTGVYTNQAKSVRRGIALFPAGDVVVHDELRGLRPGADVRWGLITRAVPDAAGGRSIVLNQEGEKLHLRIEGPAAEGLVWTTLDLATPRNEWDSPNPGVKMIAFHATAPQNGALDLRVAVRPNDPPPTSSPAPPQLDAWR